MAVGEAGPSQASLEAALALTESSKDEERFVGASILLQHASSLRTDAVARQRLLVALTSGDFVLRALASAPIYRRVSLALVRALVVDKRSARILAPICAQRLADMWSLGVVNDSKSDDAEINLGAENDSGDATNAVEAEEALEAAEALRQLARPLLAGAIEGRSKDTRALAALSAALPQLFETLLTVCSKSQVEVGSGAMNLLGPALSLLQDLSAVEAAADAADAGDQLLESLCLSDGFRGRQERDFALGILAERVETGRHRSCRSASDGAFSKKFGPILGETLVDARAAAEVAPGAAVPWSKAAAAMRLAAAMLGAGGLNSLGDSSVISLQRLRAFVKMAGGELRMGLEDRLPVEAVCAACMLLETAAVALGEAADSLESGAGQLELAAECLTILHRAVSASYEFCMLVTEAPDDDGLRVPPQLPLITRVIAVWQAEDPVRYEQEFLKALPVFCRLPVTQFEVLLPSIHDLQDWHLTPALGKVLEATLSRSASPEMAMSQKAVAQGVLMLTELALDAAVSLSESPVPEAPAPSRAADAAELSAAALALPRPPPAEFPRPLVAEQKNLAAARRLADWSRLLWAQAVPVMQPSFGVMAAALLTSVPMESLTAPAAEQDAMWASVAAGLLEGSDAEGWRSEDTATWRLSLRLCGFLLDRHPRLALALAVEAAHRRARGLRWLPVALPASPPADADVDEWRPVDEAAAERVTAFLRKTSTVSVPDKVVVPAPAPTPAPAECFSEMD